MEQWMIMGAVVLVVCIFCPPLFGVVMGAGAILLGSLVIAKILGA